MIKEWIHIFGIFFILLQRNSIHGNDQINMMKFNHAMESTYHGKELYDLINQPNRKFLIFQQSGGFNNQRIIIQRAISMCRVLNRTCIIPMAARHSSMYPAYNKLNLEEDLIDMSRVLNFTYLESFSSVVPLRDTFLNTLQYLQQSFPNEEDWYTVNFVKNLNLIAPATLEQLKMQNQKFLYLANSTIWKGFGYHKNAQKFAQATFEHIVFTNIFKSMAKKIIAAFFQDKPFFAVHFRKSDYGEDAQDTQARLRALKKPSTTPSVGQWSSHGTMTQFVPSQEWLEDPGETMRRTIHNLTEQYQIYNIETIYVATQPSRKNAALFRNLSKEYKLLFSSDIPDEIMEPFRALFTTEQTRLFHDLLGIVEQLVCAHASLFVGFWSSTFSKYIEKLRSMSYEIIE